METRKQYKASFSPARAMLYEASRAWQGWIVTALLVGVVYYFAPQQLPIFFYKLIFITLGGTMGFWLYTWMFGQIDSMPESYRLHATYQRIAMICFAMLAISLGA